MDLVNTVNQLVSNIGFPIIAYLLVWKMAHETLAEVKNLIMEQTNLIKQVLNLLEEGK